jgi:beta-lactamase regulating signal transducer with metallopeptidase domain
LLAGRLASELAIRRPSEILVVPGRLPPLVIAGRPRPVILLPIALLDQLNDSQKESMLLHEMVHIQRGDHWVRMLELVIGVTYWWLPVASLIGRQMRVCEETCCDAAVVAHRPQTRRDYAALLLDVLDFASPLPRQAVPQATAMSAANDLERRLLAILDADKGSRRTWPAGVIAVGLACAILPCELHYDFVARPKLAATSDEVEPAEGMRLPGGDREGKFSGGCCCPSN